METGIIADLLDISPDAYAILSRAAQTREEDKNASNPHAESKKTCSSQPKKAERFRSQSECTDTTKSHERRQKFAAKRTVSVSGKCPWAVRIPKNKPCPKLPEKERKGSVLESTIGFMSEANRFNNREMRLREEFHRKNWGSNIDDWKTEWGGRRGGEEY